MRPKPNALRNGASSFWCVEGANARKKQERPVMDKFAVKLA